MPRPSILSATERTDLLGLPKTQNDLIRFYTFTVSDLALIRQRRGDANRLGFAVQLCLLRYPGYGLTTDMMINLRLLQWIADQIKVNSTAWLNYAERDPTRREHLAELRLYLRLSSFKLSDFRHLLHLLTDLAMQTDKGLILATRVLEALRQNRIILPALTVIERVFSQAIVKANRQIYRMLYQPLSEHQKRQLDELLKIKTGANITWLIWLRQSPLKPNSWHML